MISQLGNENALDCARPNNAVHTDAASRTASGETIHPRTLALRIAWRALLIALLLGEVLGLTVRFDTGSLGSTDAWWARFLGQAPALLRLAAVIAVATLLFGGARLRAAYQSLPPQIRSGPVWPFLFAHLAAFGGFTGLTALLLEGEAQSLPFPGAWVFAWFLLAGLTLALWVATLLPASFWLPLMQRGGLPLLGGVVIGILAWGAGELTDFLWPPLSRWTFEIVRGLLSLLVSDPVCEPNDFIIGTSQFRVRITPECSGYEGIGLIWVFLTAYLWLHRNELLLRRALLLLPLATAGIWLANAVRIAALIALGTWASPEVAAGGFHSQAGWLVFNAIALGTVLLTQQIRWFHKRPTKSAPARTAAPAYLVPLLALLATMMVTSAFQSGFDWLYPTRVLVVGAALFCFRRQYLGLFRSWSWPAVLIGAIVFFLWLALEPTSPEETRTALPPALAGVPVGWAAVWLIFRVVGSVVTVPLAEELAFRGYLPRRLQAADFEAVPMGRFTWLSFFVSSVLFGLMHGRWLAGTLAGMFYALALYRRRDLAEPVLAHAVTNALITAYVLMTGTWSLWN